MTDVAPYEAMLLVSFGGPERPEDVIPFLENVTRGRGIPRERLAEVGEHYARLGGRSPINDQCRALIRALQDDLARHGVDVPIYWGNRNWDPYLRDTVTQMATDGVMRAAAVLTSAYSSYSGCRQYRENLFDAVDGVVGAPTIDRLRHYFNHPGFVTACADSAVGAVQEIHQPGEPLPHLVFVTHSIPTAMAETSGPNGGGYRAQHLSVAGLVAEQVGGRLGGSTGWDLVYCSRSGSPATPWLEPDINDHLERLHADGVTSVVAVPIGFVSDHIEVAYDIDTEAATTAHGFGLRWARAATVGTHPDFVAAIRDLLLERAAAESASAIGGAAVRRAVVGELGPSHDVCPRHCCPNPRGDRPALCQLGDEVA
jgi:protoporphyrin/coproporphyrin ferrochelatase